METDASPSDFDGCDDVLNTVTGGSPACKGGNTEGSQIKLERQRTIPAEEDEDEYTLCAFGDISLSNMHFVPGPLEAFSPEKKVDKSVSTRSRPIKVSHLDLLCQ